MYIAVPAEILGIILPLLLGVAFLVLAERKVMAFVQRRKGPDVVGSFGLLQPLVDGLKLILNTRETESLGERERRHYSQKTCNQPFLPASSLRFDLIEFNSRSQPMNNMSSKLPS
ncbi:hypothetical protein RDI58_002168 [Solanum bulbocastanum]|uniref:NADH-ubiquinone oxidoreductase chain 1 n=1 Tax=Solanum bulbocastanum TaxID=147425 RepID=A0AAN8U6B9_SOLBU